MASFLIKILLGLIALLVVGPLAAILAEPFYSAVVARLGIDPAAWADPVMLTLAGMWDQKWFLVTLALLIGLLVGAWCHRLAVRWDAAQQLERKNIERLVSRIQPHIENVEGRMRYVAAVCDGEKDANTFVMKMDLQAVNVSALLEEARLLAPTITGCAEEAQIAQDEINTFLAHVRAGRAYEPMHAANLYLHRATKMHRSLVKLKNALRA